ncbi:MAG TPA: MOSC domain-containing protein, partial [Longimicrobiales bacterium]|nr:MOSC domain-containing protein [Longimicrobiales bacterium]
RWRAEIPHAVLPWGAFGENLTLDDFTECEVRIGDRYRAGTAHLVVTQPRMPCYKLGVRFGRPDMPDRFLASGRSGFYLAVLKEGSVAIDDDFTLLHREPSGITVAEAVHLYAARDPEAELLRRGLDAAALPENWRRRFQRRLERAT